MNQIDPIPVEQSGPRFEVSQSQSDFEFDFFGQMVKRGTNNIHILRQHAEILVLRGDRAGALTVERKLAELLPLDAIVRYNLACALAVTGEVEASYLELLESVRLGYRDFELMDNDADLDNLRNHEGFLRLLESQRNPGLT